MIIKFTNYADSIHYLDFDETAESVGLGKPFLGEVKLKVRMDKSHSQIVLDCDLDTEAELVCDRCNDEFVAKLNRKFKLIYLFGEKPEESDTPDLYYLSLENDKIKLNGDVADYAVLSIPMKNLCKENCKGLCPHCGANLNRSDCECAKEDVNPVWAPLLKLKNNSKNK
ncbi:MAG: YceD family protein [Clostridiales bacterium]